MDRSPPAEDDLTNEEGWEDPLLPQPALPLPANSTSGPVASTLEIVRAATTAVAVCEDIDSSADLLQPLAEAYLLAVRNEARQLPNVACSTGKRRIGSVRGQAEAAHGKRAGAGQLTSSGQDLGSPRSREARRQEERVESAAPPKGLSTPDFCRTREGKAGENCRSGSHVGPSAAGIVGLSNFKSEVTSAVGDGGGEGETEKAETSPWASFPDSLRGVTQPEADGVARDPWTRLARSGKEPTAGPFEQEEPGVDFAPQADSDEVITRVAPYMQRLLVIERKRRAALSSGQAPGRQWSASILSEFTGLRQAVEAQSDSDCQVTLPASSGDCRLWSIDEWSLYCRCHPPSFDILKACDTVALCRLLTLLVEDIQSQQRSIAGNSKAGHCPGEVTTPGEVQKGTPCSCCRDPASHVTLQQACWLFGLLLYLDELQAMDADVAFCLQTLRRQCEQAREALGHARRTQNDNCESMACSSAQTTHCAERTKADEGKHECTELLLAAMNLLIVITDEFFKQK
ncbi:hypothetical protein CSUI_000649 [Cystoisospora suis]|uniref:Uncharacterized protein n=1 Tax=Cystoisospora suis TaxID=483139 RepID=A0A2C6LEM8_9APIC|nr:hypothetical protein CSUI_000649 [Cystoisospora suis]